MDDHPDVLSSPLFLHSFAASQPTHTRQDRHTHSFTHSVTHSNFIVKHTEERNFKEILILVAEK
jgi:hypothetical protein